MQLVEPLAQLILAQQDRPLVEDFAGNVENLDLGVLQNPRQVPRLGGQVRYGHYQV